jgi:hypothetical protein
MPTGEKKAKVSHELPRSIGVHEDGSIGGKGYGIEICTPPASGDKGENLLKEVCDIMARNGATVNKSCGLHVHLDVKEIDNRNANEMYRSVQRLWLFYLTFEDVLMSFLPPSRRSSNYCQSLKSDYHFREIAEAQNIDKLEKIWYRVSNQRDIVECKSESKHQTRYRGINMHTLFSERHIEIRFHSGTINFKKIAEWVNLHARIIDFAFNNNIDFEYMKKLSSSIDEGAKTREFFDMLKLSKGSRDYFLSRQEVFKGKLEKPLEAPQAIVSEITQLLANEVEA